MLRSYAFLSKDATAKLGAPTCQLADMYASTTTRANLDMRLGSCQAVSPCSSE